MKQLRILALAFCASLLFCLAPLAEDIYTEGYFQYTIEDDVISICSYFGSESEVTVPQAIAGIPVANIAEGAFADSTVSTVILPSSVQNVEDGAIPSGVEVSYAGSSAAAVTAAASSTASSVSSSASSSAAAVSSGTASASSAAITPAASASALSTSASSTATGVSEGGTAVTLSADGTLPAQDTGASAATSADAAASSNTQSGADDDMTLDEFMETVSDSLLKDETVQLNFTPGAAGFVAGMGIVLLFGAIAAIIVTRIDRKRGAAITPPKPVKKNTELELQKNKRRRKF